MKISPNYCLVTQRIIAITADSDSDEDRLPDQQTVSGDVYFTPNVASGRAYQLRDEEGNFFTVPLGRVEASIVDGEIVHEGQRGISLFAAGQGSNPSKISYSVEYRNLRAGATPISLSPMNFEAVPGGEVDLTSATPVTGATPAGTTKGDKGDQGERGLQGIQGIQGEVGPKGDKGDPGEVTLEQLNQAIRVDTSVGTRVFSGDMMIFGDTGWRDITSLIPEVASGSVRVMRNTRTAYISFSSTKFSTTSAGLNISRMIPSGFRIDDTGFTYFPFAQDLSPQPTTLRIDSYGHVYLYNVKDTTVSGMFSWPASTWPTSLPGIPA